MVTPLARVSPTGKLSVEDCGDLVATGVTATAPPSTWKAGLAPTPVTWNVFALPAVRAPAVRPVLNRVSTRRVGVRAKYVAPGIDGTGVTAGLGVEAAPLPEEFLAVTLNA